MSLRSIILKARDEGRKKLLEHEAYEILSEYKFPVPKFGLAKSEEEAVKIADSIGYPVVLKIVSPDIVHKSDVGGVIINLKDSSDVREGFRKIMLNVRNRAPNARIEGVLIQEMVPQGLEIIVGSTRDTIFGPIVMFGLGGVFVEVLRDVSFRVAPITPIDADMMIRELKAYKILEGYRGSPPRDLDAVKDILIKTSNIMLEVEEIQDIDLNPIMLFERGKGAKIADARIMLR
ncbi:acetyl-CoA synthetase (ADP-forming) beta subunit; branched-chain acyl-CoA synthetase (ADP-forming) beta subunit [Ignisphaera aggregans DSM 17230]|uniref:Acetyl-CoA synthetase (ADP-forming) beta subunit branched-chain acyl-CoA synthetase (ADP-forming) beta subunit n=1 Tax=Ignisphaera aggregans (strain DSM 17230 / JCM 13409 / AQ1.S1) TaxID=583356 RepID=E0SRD2_IGNAA|nr:acetyl-CoA synthetase (ADP-forming) beta subunit; branched-chain acyl-CoA synthetase (ADP-forming) beta subunit [Ignisphaera aggregans DSM 17230]